MIRLFSRYWTLPAVCCLLVEVGLLVGAVRLAYFLRFWSEPGFFTSHIWLRAGVFAAAVLLTMYVNGLYDFKVRRSLRSILIRLVRSFGIAAVTLWALYYATYTVIQVGRGVFALAMGLSLAALVAWRVLLSWLLRKNVFAERVLIVGADEAAIDIAREILDREHLGYNVVGFIADDPHLQGVSLINPRVLGRVSDVADIALQQRATRVVVAQMDRRGKLNLDGLLDCKTSGIPVEAGSSYYERLAGKIMLSAVRLKSSLVFSKGFFVSRGILAGKRALDLAAATTGLILALPIMLVAALAIKLESRGPIFFTQERVGRRGETFTLFKFRSMRTDAEARGAQWAQENDPRVTKVGRLLRKCRVDELPQILNVLRGDMSLVGPRPERPEFVEQLMRVNPFYRQRHVVRPGLTGWAQTQAPYAASVEESLEKLRYDLYYVKNLSILLDLSIIASTARTVLLGRGAR